MVTMGEWGRNLVIYIVIYLVYTKYYTVMLFDANANANANAESRCKFKYELRCET